MSCSVVTASSAVISSLPSHTFIVRNFRCGWVGKCHATTRGNATADAGAGAGGGGAGAASFRQAPAIKPAPAIAVTTRQFIEAQNARRAAGFQSNSAMRPSSVVGRAVSCPPPSLAPRRRAAGCSVEPAARQDFLAPRSGERVRVRGFLHAMLLVLKACCPNRGVRPSSVAALSKPASVHKFMQTSDQSGYDFLQFSIGATRPQDAPAHGKGSTFSLAPPFNGAC